MSQKVVGWLSVAAVAVVFAACTGSGDDDSSTATSTSTASSATPAPATSASAPVSTGVVEHAPVDGEHVTVATVTDGDTFQITDGRKVRVLGIDSCEDTGGHKTPGGAEATSQAEYLLETLSGGQVTLVAEPGPEHDKDGYGRILRYVKLADGSDFGVAMVGYDHTGVYQGDNDASRAYLDELYAHDLDYAASPPSGRECGTFEPAPSPAGEGHYVPVPDNDDDHDRGLPDGALTGGYCARKWWC